MKTLKQIFKETKITLTLDKKLNPIIKDLDADYLKAVKEWLKQKREEKGRSAEWIETHGFLTTIWVPVDELLGELEK